MNGLPLATVLPAADANSAADRLAGLFDAHHQRLYRLARRLAATADDALDLVQETFLRSARTPKSIPVGSSDEEAWLVRVLVNIRRDQWRKANVRSRFAGESRRSHAVSTHPEASLIARSDVWSALDALSPRRRAVVVLHELEGLAIKDVASLLGISAITVRWHLSKGRNELVGILKPLTGEK